MRSCKDVVGGRALSPVVVHEGDFVRLVRSRCRCGGGGTADIACRTFHLGKLPVVSGLWCRVVILAPVVRVWVRVGGYFKPPAAWFVLRLLLRTAADGAFVARRG